jgi:hypothetical protein
MSSIKQLIVNAIIKVSAENPALNREGEPSATEARDAFIKALLTELFPDEASITIPTAPAPAPEPSPGKKKRAPMSEEAKAAMKAKREATLAAKKAASVSPPQTPSKTDTVPEAPAKPTKPTKPKPVVEGNLAKIDPTWRKHLKAADKENAKELEPELLKYLNALSKDDFNAKKAEEHVADFIASRKSDDGKVEAELEIVEFNGKDYFVNPETKRVYEGEGECDADGNWTNYKGVGYVGMAAFADMKLD